jgi:hypothetical protein
MNDDHRSLQDYGTHTIMLTTVTPQFLAAERTEQKADITVMAHLSQFPSFFFLNTPSIVGFEGSLEGLPEPRYEVYYDFKPLGHSDPLLLVWNTQKDAPPKALPPRETEEESAKV